MTTIVTHDGKFHADDVFAVAAVLLMEKNAKVIRTRDTEAIRMGDIAIDVGGIYDEQTNRFDHHQRGGAGKRGNDLPAPPGQHVSGVQAGAAQAGIPYAAFGLVWKKFGERLCGSAPVASRVEKTLVIPIDANDNGIDLSVPTFSSSAPYDISDAMRSLNPTWQEGETQANERFREAVSFAKRIIEREIKRAGAAVAGEERVMASHANASDKRLIVLDEDYSWKDVLARLSEPLFVVHPQNGTWRVYAVRDNPHLFVNRKDFPESWAGLRDKELAKAAGVPDAVFVHRNRFMAVARSKEGAIALAQRALSS